MIATKKGLTHIQGSGLELLSDLSCIVEALKNETKFSNALIMDFVKAGLDEPSIVPPFVRMPEKSFDVSIL